MRNDTAESRRHRPLSAKLSDAPVRTEALGLLAAGIAHDLNGMLAGIGATADLLARRATPRDRDALIAISEQTSRAGALIRQLMAFAREEQLAPEPVDLDALADGLSPSLLARAGSTATIELELAPARCWSDRLAAERILINIVGNALDAIGESGSGSRIVIGTSSLAAADIPTDAPFIAPADYACLCIADDGPGVPDSIAHRIFDPYFTTRPDGHGLGLSSAFGLVKQQGGYLLHDRGPLGGARFRIFLPANGPDGLVRAD